MDNKNNSDLYDNPGPAAEGFIKKSEYAPVDCDFTDDLEHCSVKKIPVEVFHYDVTGKAQHHKGLIVDVGVKDKAEYLFLSSGIQIRLDRIQFVRSTFQTQRKTS